VRVRQREEIHRGTGRDPGVSPLRGGLGYAIEGQGGVRGTLADAFGVYSDPTVSAFLQSVPIRGASRFGGGVAERPWEFGPPGEIHERRMTREPPRFGRYRHGLPVPVAADPWHDEGGESGPEQ
jgi:hypothetical protein